MKMKKTVVAFLTAICLMAAGGYSYAADAPPYNELIVAADGSGEFTTIASALASLGSPNTVPTVIRVMPGTYTENITMKSKVHLQGAGREVTTLQAQNTQDNVILASGLNDIEISGLTVSGGTSCIKVENSASVSIRENRITGNTDAFAVDINYTTAATFSDNVVTGNVGGVSAIESEALVSGNDFSNNDSIAIQCQYCIKALISGNMVFSSDYYSVTLNRGEVLFTGNQVANSARGISVLSDENTRMTISDNTITNNGILGIIFISNSQNQGVTITHNRITGHTNNDLWTPPNEDTNQHPHLSHNIFDISFNDKWKGSYNVHSDGSPWPNQY